MLLYIVYIETHRLFDDDVGSDISIMYKNKRASPVTR